MKLNFLTYVSLFVGLSYASYQGQCKNVLTLPLDKTGRYQQYGQYKTCLIGLLGRVPYDNETNSYFFKDCQFLNGYVQNNECINNIQHGQQPSLMSRIMPNQSSNSGTLASLAPRIPRRQ
jgi:hypothetical protein